MTTVLPLPFRNLIALCCLAAAGFSTARAGTEPTFTFKKGVNISHWLSQNAGELTYAAPWFGEEDMDWIAGHGFDHIRLPVDFRLCFAADGSLDEDRVRPIEEAIGWARARGLGVVLDAHFLPGADFNSVGGDHRAYTDPLIQKAAAQCWRLMARHFAGEGPWLRFEILNEPVAYENAQLNPFMHHMLAAIRESNPTRIVYVTSNKWSSFGTVGDVVLPDDPNIALTIHFYEPIVFTHQRAPWVGFKKTLPPVSFPGTVPDLTGYTLPNFHHKDLHAGDPLTVAQIQAKFAKVSAWLAVHAPKIEVYVGEFGVYEAAEAGSKRRWIATVRSEAESRGWGWAVWDYNDSFGVRSRDGSGTPVLGGLFPGKAAAPSIRWVSSTEARPWRELPVALSDPAGNPGTNAVRLDPGIAYQAIDGIGGCFNELGWAALQAMDPAQRDVALKSLFDASGCNFNICRMGIGANDFALGWYSFDETPGDLAMANFSIERDRGALIPYMKAAMRFQPGLAVWGVPWSPPSWMKTNGAYRGGAMRQDPQILAAYALYFSKYVQAYRREGINLFAVAPQNEPRYNDNNYPQCAWTGAEINTFLRDYLVPQLRADHVDVQVWLGTIVNRDIADYVDPVLGDAVTGPEIAGVGYQYDGQQAMLATHERYPGVKMMQTETECYNGEDSWDEGLTTFGKLIADLNHYAGGYMFWNMILGEKSTSSWGWRQNSLLKLDSRTDSILYNPEFYSLKHFGHFVLPGAVRIGSNAQGENVAAFRNPTGEVVVLVRNPGGSALPMTLQAGACAANVEVPARSMNSFILSGWAGP